MLNETIYNVNHMVAVDEINTPPHIREVTILQLMLECEVFDVWMKAHIVDNIEDLSVVWEVVDGEINIDHIYDHNSGEVYWNMIDRESEWNDNDEKLLSSLLMWAELDRTIA